MGRPVIREEDVLESFIRSSGPGGQNVNKVSTCVQLVHQPTGLVVKCKQFRSQGLNRQAAWEMLRKALESRYDKELFALKQEAAKKRRANRKRSMAAKEKVLQWKKKNALRKKQRKGVGVNEQD